jgi:anti-sigma-K factor RskA
VTIDQDKDVLAAEYVLGTLGPDERAEAQALIAIDSSFADVVRGWERRLGELSAMVDPVEPPADMWDRIKAGVTVSERSAPPAARTGDAAPAADVAPSEAPTVAMDAAPETAAGEATPPGAAPALSIEALKPAAIPAPVVAALPSAEPPAAPAEVVPFRASARRWRTAAMLTGGLAACLGALVVMQTTRPELLPGALQPNAKIVEVVKTVEVPSTRPAEFVAVFQKDDASPAFLLTFDLDKRMLTVRRVGAEAQAGKSYELWLVSDKFPAPRSLGVIGAQPYTVHQPDPEYDAVVINRATYAISLEPEGGSPTGAPSGPVLYHGRLVQTTAPDFPARTP